MQTAEEVYVTLNCNANALVECLDNGFHTLEEIEGVSVEVSAHMQNVKAAIERLRYAMQRHCECKLASK
jgi:hypothetical protein